MKQSRFLCSLVTLAACANGFFPGSLQAATFGDFTYKVVGGSVTITNYPDDAAGPVEIPSEIDGRPVRSIGANAFAHCKKVTAVSIPDGVINIGQRAFGNSGLKSVTIPDSVLHVRGGAFRKCYSMKSVTLGSGVASIGGGAFEDCHTLADITVDGSNPKYRSENGILYDKLKTRIVEVPGGFVGAFTSPETLTSIKADAFRLRRSLTSVTIGDGVTSIGSRAFSDCYKLTAITIGKGVTSIGAQPFYNCIELGGVTVDGANPKYCSQDGVLFDKGKTKLIKYPERLAGEYIIPDSVTSISQSAFYDCHGLTRLTIGNGLTSIHPFAFSGCGSLTSVTVGTGVTTIRSGKYDDPFNGCEALDKVIFLGNAPQVEEDVFKYLFLPANFTIYFSPGSTGFTVPQWHGEACVSGVPEMEVKTPGSVFTDGSSSFSFGDAVVNSPVVKTFTIENTGTAPLKNLSIVKDGTNSGDFTLASPLETTLAPGASTTFDVTFEPSAAGTRTAAIHVKSYDSLHDPFDIRLEGNGTSATPVAPAASSATALSLGSLFAMSAEWSLPTSGRLAISSHGRGDKTGVEVSGGRKYLTLTVFKTSGNRSEKRVVEVSPNLLDWYSGSNHTTTLQDDAAKLVVRDNTPLAPGLKRYIRLK